MADGIALSTAGITTHYCMETTAGTRPTTGYTEIPDIKGIPDINPEPSSLDCTPLSETEWKRYIPGLKDPGGSLGLTANFTQAFYDVWTAIVSDYATAKADGLGMWLAFVIPGLTNAFYISVEPQDLGLGEASVDAVLETTAYVAPKLVAGWAVKPVA